MLRIVMDGAGDTPPNWGSEYDIHVIPINIQFGERTYLQGIDLSNQDFYCLADESGVIPQTAQPSPQQFVEFYQRIAQPGDTILSIHVTGKLSGTLASAEIAAREVAGDFHVIPIDSQSGSAAIGYMCMEARVMERAGATIEAICDRITTISQNVSVLLTLNTLEYARRSGRVKAMRAALASLLNVKPIVELREGVLHVAGQVRTRRKSLEHIVNLMGQRIGSRAANVAIVHASDPEAGNMLMKIVRNSINCQNLILTDLSISVAANLGPGTVGIVAYPVQMEKHI